MHLLYLQFTVSYWTLLCFAIYVGMQVRILTFQVTFFPTHVAYACCSSMFSCWTSMLHHAQMYIQKWHDSVGIQAVLGQNSPPFPECGNFLWFMDRQTNGIRDAGRQGEWSVLGKKTNWYDWLHQRHFHLAFNFHFSVWHVHAFSWACACFEHMHAFTWACVCFHLSTCTLSFEYAHTLLSMCTLSVEHVHAFSWTCALFHLTCAHLHLSRYTLSVEHVHSFI